MNEGFRKLIVWQKSYMFAKVLDYIKVDEYETLNKSRQEIGKMLNGLISSLNP